MCVTCCMSSVKVRLAGKLDSDWLRQGTWNGSWTSKSSLDPDPKSNHTPLILIFSTLKKIYFWSIWTNWSISEPFITFLKVLKSSETITATSTKSILRTVGIQTKCWLTKLFITSSAIFHSPTILKSVNWIKSYQPSKSKLPIFEFFLTLDSFDSFQLLSSKSHYSHLRTLLEAYWHHPALFSVNSFNFFLKPIILSF